MRADYTQLFFLILSELSIFLKDNFSFVRVRRILITLIEETLTFLRNIELLEVISK